MPRFMCLAYRDWYRDNSVFVLFPFHYIVMFMFYLNGKWSRYRGKPSWIDKKVVERIEYLKSKGLF